MGDRIVDTVLFHATCESEPRKDSGGRFKTPVLKKRKANPIARKRMTNLVRDIFMYTDPSLSATRMAGQLYST